MIDSIADCPTAATVQHEHGFGQGQEYHTELRKLQVTLLTIVTMLADGAYMGG